jgi:hypothetical protein
MMEIIDKYNSMMEVEEILSNMHENNSDEKAEGQEKLA